MPAWVAWQYNPAVRICCQHLKANGTNGKLSAWAAQRKLIHSAFAILKSGKLFAPNFVLA